MVDRFFAAVLVLSITGTIDFVGAYLGSFQMGTLGVMVVVASYIALNSRIAGQLMSRPLVTCWLVALALWPIAGLVYSPAANLRSFAFTLHVTGIFLATAVFVSKLGWHRSHRWFVAAFWISVIGIYFSILRPSTFEIIARAQEAADIGKGNLSRGFQGRGFGFLLQPNASGYAIILLLLAYLSGLKSTSLTKRLILVFVAATTCLLTGSRAATIGLLIFCVLYFIYLVRESPFAFWQGGASVAAKIIPTALVFLTVSVMVLSIYSQFQQEGVPIIERFSRLLPGGSETARVEEISLYDRLEIKVTAMRIIADKPLIGYGTNGVRYLIAAGVLPMSIHDTVLERAVELGIPYVLVVAALLFAVWNHRVVRQWTAQALAMNLIPQFIACTLFLATTCNTLDNMELWHAMLGVIVAIRVNPQLLASGAPHDSDTALSESDDRGIP